MEKIENKLFRLFDYQRFEKNTALQGVIDEVLDRYAQNQFFALSDDSLAMAAGGTRGLAEEEDREPKI